MLKRQFLEKRRAFTVLELLLCLGVLAVLVALLFPVLAAARKQGRVTTCTNRLRQLGTAMALYQADYNGYPRPGQLARAAAEPRVLFCPEDPRPDDSGSSYVFRAAAPPSGAPFWDHVELDPGVVVITCPHHQERVTRTAGESLRVGPPRWPYTLALRASGAVQRIPTDRIREVMLPGTKPTFARHYPEEPAFELPGDRNAAR